MNNPFNPNNLFTKDNAWKVVAAGSALLAGAVVRSVLNSSWKAVTKNDPPLNPASAETTWREALVWTVASSVAIGLVQLVARRGADAAWRTAIGERPPQPNATAAGL